jgi:hypothetical protein
MTYRGEGEGITDHSIRVCSIITYCGCLHAFVVSGKEVGRAIGDFNIFANSLRGVGRAERLGRWGRWGRCSKVCQARDLHFEHKL